MEKVPRMEPNKKGMVDFRKWFPALAVVAVLLGSAGAARALSMTTNGVKEAPPLTQALMARVHADQKAFDVFISAIPATSCDVSATLIPDARNMAAIAPASPLPVVVTPNTPAAVVTAFIGDANGAYTTANSNNSPAAITNTSTAGVVTPNTIMAPSYPAKSMTASTPASSSIANASPPVNAKNASAITAAANPHTRIRVATARTTANTATPASVAAIRFAPANSVHATMSPHLASTSLQANG